MIKKFFFEIFPLEIIENIESYLYNYNYQKYNIKKSKYDEKAKKVEFLMYLKLLKKIKSNIGILFKKRYPHINFILCDISEPYSFIDINQYQLKKFIKRDEPNLNYLINFILIGKINGLKDFDLIKDLYVDIKFEKNNYNTNLYIYYTCNYLEEIKKRWPRRIFPEYLL